MRVCYLFLLVFVADLVSIGLFAQVYSKDEPLAHTYSIVAYDEETGEMGVAVQSHWFQVGTIVTWGKAGVGVVATQSFANPQFGPDGLDLMESGKTPRQALEYLINGDDGRNYRQVALLNSDGAVAAYTGSACIEAAGHYIGKHYSVQANMMKSDKVWPAMRDAFEKAKGKLAERMIAALHAAEAAGGDIRGKQSAALLIVSGTSTGKSWLDRKVDLRVDDHEDPLNELERLYHVHEAYRYMNEGDVAMEKSDVSGALKAYQSAIKLNAGNVEMQFWYAVALANAGKLNKAKPVFQKVFDKNEDWKELTVRIHDNGLLRLSKDELDKILEE